MPNQYSQLQWKSYLCPLLFWGTFSQVLMIYCSVWTSALDEVLSKMSITLFMAIFQYGPWVVLCLSLMVLIEGLSLKTALKKGEYLDRALYCLFKTVILLSVSALFFLPWAFLGLYFLPWSHPGLQD